MPGEILRRPQDRLDLIDIWNYIADDNEAAADRMLDRIEGVLQMLSEQPKAGRERFTRWGGDREATQPGRQFQAAAQHSRCADYCRRHSPRTRRRLLS